MAGDANRVSCWRFCDKILNNLDRFRQVSQMLSGAYFIYGGEFLLRCC